MYRFLTGIDGDFNLLQTDWTWDAYLSYGRSTQHVISGKYATGFQLGLMAKDVKIAADLAEGIAIDAPMARLARALWAEAREGIGERADFTAAIKHWQRRDSH